MFTNDLRNNFMYDTGDGEGGIAVVADPSVTEVIEKETPVVGAVQDDNFITIGDEKFDKNDPDVLTKMAQKGRNLYKGLNKKSQELAQAKKVTPANKVVETPTKPTNDVRMEKLYKNLLQTNAEKLIKTEKARFKGELGEKFDAKTEAEYDKYTSGLKNLETAKLEQVIEKGNLDMVIASVMYKVARTGAAINTTTKVTTPESIIKKQETIPNQPASEGKQPVGTGEKTDKSYDPSFKRSAAKAKEARSIRQGSN
jgi:hypothetical protein